MVWLALTPSRIASIVTILSPARPRTSAPASLAAVLSRPAPAPPRPAPPRLTLASTALASTALASPPSPSFSLSLSVAAQGHANVRRQYRRHDVACSRRVALLVGQGWEHFLSLTHTLPHALALCHTRTLTHSLTQSRLHTHARTHTHSLSHTHSQEEPEVAVPLISMMEIRTVLGSTTDRKLKEAVEQVERVGGRG